MSKLNHDHPAVKTLLSFFKEMNRWEWQMIRENYDDIAEWSEEDANEEVDRRKAIHLSALSKVMKKYCECGEKANRITDGMYHGADEPDYNPATEAILAVEIDGDSVFVETQMAHNFQHKYRYELVKVDRKWMIKEPRRYFSSYSPRSGWRECGL